jgi:maltooligosyltrehalose trehalohydrolase
LEAVSSVHVVLEFFDDAAAVPGTSADGEELYRFADAVVATDCVRSTGPGVVGMR